MSFIFYFCTIVQSYGLLALITEMYTCHHLNHDCFIYNHHIKTILYMFRKLHKCVNINMIFVSNLLRNKHIHPKRTAHITMFREKIIYVEALHMKASSVSQLFIRKRKSRIVTSFYGNGRAMT